MSEPGKSSPRYRALIQLLRTAEDLWNASRVFFARWNLSPSQFNVINVLSDHPQGLSQSELSRLLIMHRSNATGLVDRLERRHLVRREPNPADRRAYRVVLTQAGADLLREVHPFYFAAAERVWTDVAETQAQELLDRLRELAAQAAIVAASGGHGHSADGGSRLPREATEVLESGHLEPGEGSSRQPTSEPGVSSVQTQPVARAGDLGRGEPPGFVGHQQPPGLRPASSEPGSELRTSDL